MSNHRENHYQPVQPVALGWATQLLLPVAPRVLTECPVSARNVVFEDRADEQEGDE